MNELPYTDNTTETAEMGNRAIEREREAVLLNSTSKWVSERVCVCVCVCVCVYVCMCVCVQ